MNLKSKQNELISRSFIDPLTILSKDASAIKLKRVQTGTSSPRKIFASPFANSKVKQYKPAGFNEVSNPSIKII